MRHNELVVRLSDGEYFLVVNEAGQDRWKVRPAQDRTNARAIEMGLHEFQILAAPKKPFVAAVLSACDKDGNEQPWFFKDYATKLEAAQHGANDLGLQPGESFMVAQHRIFEGGWGLLNVAWYIVGDDMCKAARVPLLSLCRG